MEAAVFLTKLPRGELPTRGFRCPVCGDEVMLASEVGRLHDLGERLGLGHPKRVSHRRLLRVGNSMGLTLEPAVLRLALGDVTVGQDLTVEVHGDSIIIRRSDP